MDTAVRLFQAHHRWRVREVYQGEDGQGKERTLGKIRGWNGMAAFAGAQQEGPRPLAWRVKQDTVKLRRPAPQLFIQRFKSFWSTIPKLVKDYDEIGAGWPYLYARLERCMAGYYVGVECVNTDSN